MIMAMVAKTDDVGGDDCDDESDTAFYTNQAKAGLRPARPRLDHWARIHFCNVLNQQNCRNQPKTMKPS